MACSSVTAEHVSATHGADTAVHAPKAEHVRVGEPVMPAGHEPVDWAPASVAGQSPATLLSWGQTSCVQGVPLGGDHVPEDVQLRRGLPIKPEEQAPAREVVREFAVCHWALKAVTGGHWLPGRGRKGREKGGKKSRKKNKKNKKSHKKRRKRQKKRKKSTK